VEKSGGGYMVLDRRTANPVARLRPIPDTDRFELFIGQRQRSLDNVRKLARMKLMLDESS